MSSDNNAHDTESNDEQPPNDACDALPVDRRDLLEGSLASTIGMWTIPGLAEGTTAAPVTDEANSSTVETDAAARESRPFPVLLTNFESKWTDGWTSVEYFETGSTEYFFLLKEATGRINLHTVKNHNGYINDDVNKFKTSSGLTAVKFYEVDGDTYLLLLSESDGMTQVLEMNDPQDPNFVTDYDWASGWTSVEFYEDGSGTYLFLLKKGNGEVHIHEMKTNGRVGRMTMNTSFASGWTSAELYEAGNDTYLFLLKESDGTVEVHEMNNGSIAGRRHTYDWASDWTTVEFYQAGGDTYLFLLKESDGVVHIHEMNSDGSVGDLEHAYNWTSGWTNATFYRPNSRGRHHCLYRREDTTYLSLLKESNGEGHLHEIDEDGGVGRRLNPDRPAPPSYYENLITEAGQGQGLVADYWRNVSHGNMDIRGSEVYGWLTIQKTWEEVKSEDRGDQIDASIQAAENASGPPNDLPNDRVIAVHSEPPESGSHGKRVLAHPFATGVTFFAHEMGHCFETKLPHPGSNLQFLATHDDYDDPWDVMSAMEVCRSVYSADEPEGPIGPGLNAFNRNLQGWLDDWHFEIVEPDDGLTTEHTIKSLSKPFENNDETLVVKVNIPDDSTNDYHYLVELRTGHGFDKAMKEPVALLHRIIHNPGDNNGPNTRGRNQKCRVLRRTRDETYSDAQGWSNRRPFSYVFDDDERIGITARNVQETTQPEGGTADIYVGTEPGNVRLHQLDRERVGGEIGRHDWAEGWTTAETYEVDGQKHLFLLKQGDGEVHIHEMNDDGTVGTYKFTHNWASGWSSVEFYEAGGQTFLFLLAEGGSSGRVHIHEMKDNGNVGSMTTDVPMTSGLTHAESYEVNGQTYMSLMNGNDGFVYAIEMTDAGTFGSIVDAHQSRFTWFTAEYYEADGDTYLFLMRDRPVGDYRIHEIDADGSIGGRVAGASMDSGMAQVEFYEAYDDPYVLRLSESDGSLEIRAVNDDGTLGDEKHAREWSSGWTTATVYEIDDAPHLFILKETGK